MYNAFDFDEEVETEKPKSPIKQRQQQLNERYISSITKNFLMEVDHQEEPQLPNSPTKDYRKESTARQRRRPSKRPSNLAPLANPQRIDVFSNLNSKVNHKMDVSDDLEQIIIDKFESSPEKGSKLKEMEISLEQPLEPEGQKKPNINFLYEEEEIVFDQVPVEVNMKRGNILLPFLDEEQLQTVKITSAINYFALNNRKLLREQIYSYVRHGCSLQMIMHRDNSGFNTFWPEFHACLKTDNTPLFSAKRTTARPISTFILSAKMGDFEEESQNYLGKIKSNALGDILYVFGQGPNPKNAKEKGISPREMKGTVVYNTNFFSGGRPRQFTVYILKPNVSYFTLAGVDMYDQEIGLDQLFNKYETNRDKIVHYSNRRPIWNEEVGGFMLNFNGRVGCASIKNFILQDAGEKEALMFGRRDQNEFVLQVTELLSPFVAFAIALSSFDTKLVCE